MKRNEPGSLRNIIIGFLAIMLAFILLGIYSTVKAAVNPVADNIVLDIQCAGQRMGRGKCVQGQELQGPVLNFSDLISGPASGLGDGATNGTTSSSGVIVTLWGQNLGSSKSISTIEYCDFAATCREAYVYYWKNADGTLPSGPANLYESHGMQEVAISIPAGSVNGAGTIKVTVGGASKTLPFTVRAGNIYHVKSTGNDTTGNGSFANPWLTIDKADGDSGAVAGDTIYIHDVLEGSETTDKAIYLNNVATVSTLAAQFGYAAYPNTRPVAWGHRGFESYNDQVGVVISKLTVYASEADEDVNGQPINSRANVTGGIFGTKDGRAVGNFVTDSHPSDTNGGCPDGQQGAISGNADGRNKVENWKVFGNHIYDYGCEGTTNYHHTTYFAVRSGDTNLQLLAPEVAFNYLQDNKAQNGLHIYDEVKNGSVTCGDFISTFKLHNNVVVNQSGAGFMMGARCPSSANYEVYQNVFINSGLRYDWDGINGSSDRGGEGKPSSIYLSIGDSQAGNLDFYNNTFYEWGVATVDPGMKSCIAIVTYGDGVTIDWNDNICFQSADNPFIQSSTIGLGSALEDNITGAGNSWYTSAAMQVNAVPPTWDATKILTDPLLTVDGSQVSVGAGSPLINQSSTTLPVNLMGEVRDATSTTGAR